ncbi:MAG: hypothetical protein NC337_14115, partial [Roseburia sp.]|nr:hypothetical protein [Roseburia sp.]
FARDNTMITKIKKTSDTRCIPSKKPPKMPCKSSEIIPISPTENREGGRTAGSGRVASIIE